MRSADGAGPATTIRARWLLGCDGAAGVVRDQIGARYVGRSDPRPELQRRLPGARHWTPTSDPAVQYWVVGARPPDWSAGSTWPGPGGRSFPGIEAGVRGGARLRADHRPARRPGASTRCWPSDPWTARMLIADTFRDRPGVPGRRERAREPARGAATASTPASATRSTSRWKIAAVEQGWASPELLDSYEPERRGVVEQTVASAEANMRSLAGDLPADGPAIQRAKRPEFHSLGLVLGYSYAGSPVVQPTARHPRSGRRDALHAVDRAGRPAAARGGCPTARRSTTGWARIHAARARRRLARGVAGR